MPFSYNNLREFDMQNIHYILCGSGNCVFDTQKSVNGNGKKVQRYPRATGVGSMIREDNWSSWSPFEDCSESLI